MTEDQVRDILRVADAEKAARAADMPNDDLNSALEFAKEKQHEHV